MPTSAVITIKGHPILNRKLKMLPIAIQKKVLRQSMRAGLKIVQQGVKAEVPVDTGLTRRNVAVRAVKRKKRGSIELEVRIKAEKGLKKLYAGGQSVFYPAVVQYGRAGVAPNPFMTRAFQATASRARRVTIQALKAGVDRVIRSL